jgi:hypothetical protein
MILPPTATAIGSTRSGSRGRAYINPSQQRAYSRGRSSHFHAPLYISFLIIHTKQTGGGINMASAMAMRARPRTERVRRVHHRARVDLDSSI